MEEAPQRADGVRARRLGTPRTASSAPSCTSGTRRPPPIGGPRSEPPRRGAPQARLQEARDLARHGLDHDPPGELPDHLREQEVVPFRVPRDDLGLRPEGRQRPEHRAERLQAGEKSAV